MSVGSMARKTSRRDQKTSLLMRGEMERSRGRGGERDKEEGRGGSREEKGINASEYRKAQTRGVEDFLST